MILIFDIWWYLGWYLILRYLILVISQLIFDTQIFDIGDISVDIWYSDITEISPISNIWVSNINQDITNIKYLSIKYQPRYHQYQISEYQISTEISPISNIWVSDIWYWWYLGWYLILRYLILVISRSNFLFIGASKMCKRIFCSSSMLYQCK
jgi:hypothetical protein